MKLLSIHYLFSISSNLLFILAFPDSVKSLLGRHTKILIKYMVKLETKGDKTDNRVLVSTFVRNYNMLIVFFFFHASYSS